MSKQMLNVTSISLNANGKSVHAASANEFDISRCSLFGVVVAFFACIYVLNWIELIVLFVVWNEWNITAIRLIRFSYFALDFSTDCRFQLQCPYNSFVKNRRRFWLFLLFCIKDVRKRARTRLIRLSNWPHL